MRLTINHRTANSALMMTNDVRNDVLEGIDDPSDAIVTWGVTLYRVAHASRYDKATGLYEPSGPDAAYESNWWSTSDHFLTAT
jgi:hypothetical protein